MRIETAEWVSKAEGDFNTAHREFAVKEFANYDAVCFHAQQCAEKYIKARLIEGDVHFPRTHDLEVLLNLLLALEPEWENLRESAQLLTSMAVEVRYPGTLTDQDDAQQSITATQLIRETVRNKLNDSACATPASTPSDQCPSGNERPQT